MARGERLRVRERGAHEALFGSDDGPRIRMRCREYERLEPSESFTRVSPVGAHPQLVQYDLALHLEDLLVDPRQRRLDTPGCDCEQLTQVRFEDAPFERGRIESDRAVVAATHRLDVLRS